MLIAGVTPFPYKVITILSGATGLQLRGLMLARRSRAASTFLVAALLRRFGEPIRNFIEKRLEFCIVFRWRPCVRRFPGGGAGDDRTPAALAVGPTLCSSSSARRPRFPVRRRARSLPSLHPAALAARGRYHTRARHSGWPRRWLALLAALAVLEGASVGLLSRRRRARLVGGRHHLHGAGAGNLSPSHSRSNPRDAVVLYTIRSHGACSASRWRAGT